MKLYMILVSSLLLSSALQAHVNFLLNEKPEIVISDLDKLRAVDAFILSHDEESNLGIAQLSPMQMSQISNITHFEGKCAGFEVLNSEELSHPGMILQNLVSETKRMKTASPIQMPQITLNQSYKDLADQANAQSLKLEIEWLSSYPTRYNRDAQPNTHVNDLTVKLQTILKSSLIPYTIDQVTHTSTKQKSVRLKFTGQQRPDEIVVLGAHLDSINQSFFGSTLAPGADDNASGSSSLIEAVKILSQAKQPERTLEFFWYAGEESGLLGSAEIAKSYKAEMKNVIAVLQLDMTLFPGSGEQVIGLVNDYTSPWLNEIFTSIYKTYLNGNFIPDTCGYGCSDHASWHRQGFPAVIPFEATTSTMNPNIHSEKDVLNSRTSVNHANTFTKLAILFALELGNSNVKQP